MFLLDELIFEWAGKSPARDCVVDGVHVLRCGELESFSRRLAHELTTRAVTPGSRVVVVASNSLESVVACVAVLRAGCVLVPVSPEARISRLRAIIDDCEPSVVLAPQSVFGQLASDDLATVRSGIALESVIDRAHLHESHESHESHDSHGARVGGPPDSATKRACAECTARHLGVIDRDVALIVYTSGSSGEPKGVMLTHANLVNSTAAIAQYLEQTDADILGCAIPIAFSYGLIQLLTSLRFGSKVVLERSFVFPAETLRSIAQHKVTLLPAVPTMIARLIDIIPRVEFDLSSLRAMTNAAAALPPAHALRITELLPWVALHLMYGQTECTRACTLPPNLVRTHPASVGRAIPNSEVYLIDEDGRRLPNNSEGELVVRGANVMRGYWRKPAETAASLVAGEQQGELVLRTGDRFRSDAQGLLSFVARMDEIFKCRGEKIAPAAIEHVLCAIPGVSDAAVVGIEHAEDGMAIKATIVLREGCVVDERTVRAHCKATLEAGHTPRFIEFRDALPRTLSGKLQRKALVDAGTTA